MKINNRFISRLFAGFVVATVVATSIPVSTFAEEISAENGIVSVQEIETVENDIENIVEETEVSVPKDIIDELEESNDSVVNEDIRDVEIEAVPSEDQLHEDEEIDPFFQAMTEAAQAALPLESVLSEPSVNGKATIQWRSSATNPYVSSTTPGTVRFITQNSSSPLYSASYWGDWAYRSKYECGTTSQSMALSYLGVNLTPSQLLTLGGGVSRIGTSYADGITGGYDHQGYPGCNGTALKQAINNYLANKKTNPKYSPVMIHLNNYPAAYGGVTVHYIVIIDVIDEAAGIYQTVDPWDNTVTEVKLTFGTYPTATYTAFTTTVTSDSVDEFYQFVNPKGSTGEIKPATPDPGSGSGTTTEKDTLTSVNNKEGVVLTDQVNVRKEPVIDYTNANVIATVDKFTSVTIVGKTTNWYKVKFTYQSKTKTGYIHKNYVGVGSRPSKLSISLKAFYNNRMKVGWKKQSGVTGYKVQRYDNSAKKWKTIKTITGDSTTSYLDTGLTNGTTYKYRVYAYKTWTRDQNYTLNSPASATLSKKASKYMNAKTNGSSLNVRKGPGTSYGILKTLNRSGVEVRVYALKNTWYKVMLPVRNKMTVGYIKKEYVNL